MKTNNLPQIGERIVVYGMTQYDTRVEKITYVPQEARHHIALDWGQYGKSRVYDTDEGKTWYRLGSIN